MDCPDSTWPAVRSFVDGDEVDAKTLNHPIRQLASRTEHLLRLLKQIDHSKVSVADAALQGPDFPSVGQVVYRTPDGTYARALGSAEENAWFYASPQAMAVGVVGSKPSADAPAGTVVLCGYVSLGESGVDAGDVIADTDPASGRYYLSNTVPGKLTANPTGPIVYVCDCQVSGGKVTSMLVNPQYRDTGESHIHRSFVLDWKPQGMYSYKGSAKYDLYGWLPDGKDTSAKALRLFIYGAWDTDSTITYTLTVKCRQEVPTSSWDDYVVECTSDTASEGTQTIPLSALGVSGGGTKETAIEDGHVGTHNMIAVFQKYSGVTIDTPASIVGHTWTVEMPDKGRAWVKSAGGGSGLMLNLGMYPALSRYVPVVPSNSGALVVDGLELRGPVFGSAKQWYIAAADEQGGPWLVWVDRSVVSDGSSATTPWVHYPPGTAVVEASKRYIALHVGRMRVGPTGFVTSLQPAAGSPIRITSALTDTDAVQGALQVGLDVDFKSGGGDAAGFQVVKRIDGTTFVTGPVVERVVPGPGLSANQEQGIVRLSMSNAVYAGDFETIALKNAKQDLAGGVFPYTKLLGWSTGGTNVDSGFTAKFRVPDHIPYNADRGYYVVVSASVFGEEGRESTSFASFRMRSYVLGDQACSADAVSSGFVGSISNPDGGYLETIGVRFTGSSEVPYRAFDPVLVHGFRKDDSADGPGSIVIADTESRMSVDGLWLRNSGGGRVKVYPGYFVGLSVERCATDGDAYTAPIGFLSLRWNLVEAPKSS